MLSHFSCVQLFVTPWTVACQAALSMGFSRQEYWRLAISFSRGSSQSGIEPSNLCLLHWKADSLTLYHLGSPYLHY